MGEEKKLEIKFAADCDASLTRSQIICYWLAKDTAKEKPLIGSNIHAGPDLAAPILHGESGAQLADNYLKVHKFAQMEDEKVIRIAQRTCFYDKKWTEAQKEGVKQFVMLGSGLCSRAWRLPNLSGCTVYEVDTPKCHAFKRTKIPDLDMYTLECKRVEVEADFSDSSWAEKLKAKGFNPNEKSFFIAEGVTMYLTEESAQSLFKTVPTLQCEGSHFLGDALSPSVKVLEKHPEYPILVKLGTQWTWAIETDDALSKLVKSNGYSECNVTCLYGNADYLKPDVEDGKEPKIDEEKAKNYAHRIMEESKVLAALPEDTHGWIVSSVEKGDDGIKEMLETILDDKSNSRGLKEESPEMKKRITELCLEDGFLKIVKSGAAEIAKRALENGRPIRGDPSKPRMRYWLFMAKKA